MLRKPVFSAMGAVALLLAAASALAHDGVEHRTQTEALKHQMESSNTPGFPDIKGGDFTLVDHRGRTRTSRNPDGHFQLLFFGYANCEAICSVALPRMADAIDLLAEDDITVTPILITVDPQRDTVETLKDRVGDIHPRLIGLTGEPVALSHAYKAFQIEKSLVYEHPEAGPIYAHGSFLYLLSPDGGFETILPPILSPERIADVVKGYVGNSES